MVERDSLIHKVRQRGGASGGREKRNPIKTTMEVVGGVTESVGKDWANSRNRAENHGIKEAIN